MNRQEHYHGNPHQLMTSIKPNSYLAPFNSIITRSISKRFKSVNLTVHSGSPNQKGEIDHEQIRKKHSETTQATREHEIYFSRTKKYNYMKQIIDKYFQQSRKDKPSKGVNPQSSVTKNFRTLIPKISKNREEKVDEDKNDNLEDRKYKNKQFLSKRKNKTTIQKNQQEQLQSSVQASKMQSDKPAEQSISKAFSFCSTRAINLPPIDQMFEDKDEQLLQDFAYESISILNDSSVDIAKENRMLIVDSEIYIVEFILINGKLHHKLKTFKQKGQQILKRELRALSLGVQSTWIQYRYDPRCLISAPNKSLKDLLFKVKKVDAQGKFFTLKTGKYYKKLLTNNCEQLIRVTKQFCEFMNKFQGKILNNKINTGNLYISKNENIRLGEWGYASFKETHLIQNFQFQNRIEPIVKSQKQWFVSPQYLAPQILKAIVLGEDIDLMSFGSAPDVWSFGLTLLEIITIIPIWIQQKCTIFGKSMQARSGLLAVGERDLKKLLKKQEKMGYLVTKLFEQEYSEQNFNHKIIQVITRCLEFLPQNRPNFAEILQLLK